MLPDLIILGDSHCNALVEGCAAHGLKAEMLRFSGNFWHEGSVILHPEHGVWAKRPNAQQGQILALRDRLGGRSILSEDVPIVATMGFHLGRLVPPFGLMGHVTEQRHFAADPAAHYVSQSFTDAYLGVHRGTLVRMARRMARQAPLTIVAPPIFRDDPNMHVFLQRQIARMQAVGLTVHNPNADLGDENSVLPTDLVTEDGVHGNARYGTKVIAAMLAKRLVQRRD